MKVFFLGRNYEPLGAVLCPSQEFYRCIKKVPFTIIPALGIKKGKIARIQEYVQGDSFPGPCLNKHIGAGVVPGMEPQIQTFNMVTQEIIVFSPIPADYKHPSMAEKGKARPLFVHGFYYLPFLLQGPVEP